MSEEIFKYQDLKAWLNKVFIDTKGQTQSDMLHELAGISMPLFLHPDHLVKPIQLGKVSDVFLGENFSISADESTNTEILNALSFGVTAPCFSMKEWDKSILNDSLRNVNTDIVFPLFEFEDTCSINHLEQLIEEKSKDNTRKIGLIIDDVDQFKKLQFPENSAVEWTILLKVGVVADVDNIATIAQEINELIRFILTKNMLCNVGVSMHTNASYLEQIGVIRAIRIVGMNVLKARKYGEPKDFFIDAQIACANIIEFPQQIIASTIMALAALISGCNRISIELTDSSGEYPGLMRKRIARNIFHLMSLESGILDVGDPAAGSFYFDKLTGDLASKAWEQFIKKQGQPVS